MAAGIRVILLLLCIGATGASATTAAPTRPPSAAGNTLLDLPALVLVPSDVGTDDAVLWGGKMVWESDLVSWIMIMPRPRFGVTAEHLARDVGNAGWHAQYESVVELTSRPAIVRTSIMRFDDDIGAKRGRNMLWTDTEGRLVEDYDGQTTPSSTRVQTVQIGPLLGSVMVSIPGQTAPASQTVAGLVRILEQKMKDLPDRETLAPRALHLLPPSDGSFSYYSEAYEWLNGVSTASYGNIATVSESERFYKRLGITSIYSLQYLYPNGMGAAWDDDPSIAIFLYQFEDPNRIPFDLVPVGNMEGAFQNVVEISDAPELGDFSRLFAFNNTYGTAQYGYRYYIQVDDVVALVQFSSPDGFEVRPFVDMLATSQAACLAGGACAPLDAEVQPENDASATYSDTVARR